MEVETARRDAAALDPELLQLPELAPGALRENSGIAEALYSQWLTLPETSKLVFLFALLPFFLACPSGSVAGLALFAHKFRVKSLIEDAKAGATLNVAGSSANTNAASSSSLPSMFPAGSAPPLSPRSTSGSPRIMRRGSAGPSSLGSPLKLVSEPVREVIPQFYFKNGRPPPRDLKEQCLSRIDHLFFGGEGLQAQEFRQVTKDICKIPSFLSSVLFKKIDVACTGTVSRDAFVDYWINDNKITMDMASQIFEILRKPGYSYLTQDDFKPVLKELLASHPGLEFLQGTPEFQERYAETVIYRIFYSINRSGNGHLTLRELKRGNLVSALQQLDEEEDINKVLRFKCIDLDGNGILTSNEMQFFYEEQLHRMECMAQEPVLFEDILCQMIDMIGPENESYFTLRDLKRCKLSGNIFNILFNLNKFMAFETRDPFLIRQERENPNLTEWDRFAHREYIRLSMEEDGEDASNGSGDVWDESLEAPF
ncbi:hypothetical protein PR202_ga00510 [Eleusine coracana subsp. coracana]|uniref:PP2A regulatory subunit B'' EF-hand domain-containing protein n=1 Tax=Eleusine coracana subsp. coracana TaxID=191504 RepID=A0AAV5BHL3_ELECO|nr:hypothetical protein PR202_ga00510 [Eleusine coracana subsp. coracana]